jgi:deazaflavin-dependent oxidoreductase (nitroreductase family)
LKKTNPSSSSKDSSADEEPYLYLTTRGRQTGRPREIEIWFTQREGFYYVIAEYETSHWLRNLQADPHVTVKVGAKRFQAEARVLMSESDLELQGQVQQLSRSKYGWGDGIVVELIPMPS